MNISENVGSEWIAWTCCGLISFRMQISPHQMCGCTRQSHVRL
jgi:hypothetical protein